MCGSLPMVQSALRDPSLFVVYAYDSMAGADPTKFILGAFESKQEAFARQADFCNALGGCIAAAGGVSRSASGHVSFVNEIPYGRGCYVELFTRLVAQE